MGTRNAVLCAAAGWAHSALQQADMGNSARTPGIIGGQAFLKINCWNNQRISALKCLLGNWGRCVEKKWGWWREGAAANLGVITQELSLVELLGRSQRWCLSPKSMRGYGYCHL